MPVSSPRQLYFSFRQIKKGLILISSKCSYSHLQTSLHYLPKQQNKQEEKNPTQQIHESHENYFASKDMINV